MTPITNQQVADAIAYIENLDFDAKVQSCGHIAEAQPAILGAVVQLKSAGVDSATHEHAFHILMVLFECFTRSVADLPQITQEMVQKALDNSVSMLDLLDGESPQEAARLRRISVENYPERNVLAFVTGYLHEHGLSHHSRENELVVHVCKAITDALVEARQMTEDKAT